MASSRIPLVITESLEPVRLRPGMYFGGTEASGLGHLAFEVIGNSIDQHLMERATQVSIDVSGRWLTVSDDRDGISVEPDERVGMSWLESVFTSMHMTPTVPAMERVVRGVVADTLSDETDLRVTWLEALSRVGG